MHRFLRAALAITITMLLLPGCRDTEKSRATMQAALTPMQEQPIAIEFFMYGCPHCKKMEPQVLDWQSKQKLLFQQGTYTFEQVPAIFSANWRSDGKVGSKEAALYYALRRMGMESQHRQKLFDAIQRHFLDAGDEQSIAAFAEREHIPAAELLATLKSNEVKADVDRAEDLTRRYRVFSTPSFVLFNRQLILPQEYPDNTAVEEALLTTMKKDYLRRVNVETAAQ